MGANERINTCDDSKGCRTLRTLYDTPRQWQLVWVGMVR
jgi:hypothetical protein